MDATEVDVARQALCEREGISKKNEIDHIGTWSVGQRSLNLLPGLPKWASSRGVDHVIWTALPAKFNGDNKAPTQHQVGEYLGGLTGAQRDNAERYIRLAPKQIDTEYRRHIEAVLQWTACDAVHGVILDPLTR